MKREYEKERIATALPLLICERKIDNRIELHAIDMRARLVSKTFCGLVIEGWKIRYPSSEAPNQIADIGCRDCARAFKRAEKAEKKAQQSR